jgi:hypothetical protein
VNKFLKHGNAIHGHSLASSKVETSRFKAGNDVLGSQEFFGSGVW